jgi:hypothetical protein
MSYNYINGYNVAKLEVLHNGTTIDLFIFPLEDPAGKREEIQDDVNEIRLINNGEILQEVLGTHLVWTIPYEEGVRLEVSKIMKKLRAYRKNNPEYLFNLTPNIDVAQRVFDVLLYKEKISLGIDAAIEDASCNTGMTFGFISRFYVDENWIDKNEIPTFNLRNYKFISYS